VCGREGGYIGSVSNTSTVVANTSTALNTNSISGKDLAPSLPYFVHKNGNDEIIQGQPLREVGVVEGEEEKGEDEDKVLTRELGVRTSDQFHTHNSHSCGRTTVSVCVCVCVRVCVRV